MLAVLVFHGAEGGVSCVLVWQMAVALQAPIALKMTLLQREGASVFIHTPQPSPAMPLT